MRKKKAYVLLILLSALLGCEKDEVGMLELLQVFVGTTEITLDGTSTGLPLDRSIALVFSHPLHQSASDNAVALRNGAQLADISTSVSGNSIIIFPAATLAPNTIYTIDVSEKVQGTDGERFKFREVSFRTAMADLQVISLEIGGMLIQGTDRVLDVPLDLDISITFSVPVDEQSFKNAMKLTGTGAPALTIAFSNNNQTAKLTGSVLMKDFTKYTLTILNSLKGQQGENFSEYKKLFYTGASDTPKFPVISDDELLLKVQQQTFKYFYDFAHPASGMARERNTSGDIVTSGGTGFGIMALIVGIERDFITRTEGLTRMKKIVSYLESADRFHGVWPHWLNGSRGKVVPFSANDNGGDLVETSFLVQGLLTFRQYLNAGIPEENDLINRINVLWQEVEWDWYRKNGEDVLYWHWSPDKGWIMNFALSGYFEQQITYLLAAASPTHTIPKIVYTNGFAQNGAIVRNDVYYGYPLKLGGLFPLFWVHYSYLGLDPNFTDAYANYWNQNVNASLINYEYCKANPKNFVGYSDECWGLTSSDNESGYNAHSPANDLGVITPTAALSSFPYTPVESMKALKFFYYKLGDRLWGEYGFYDAFNLTTGWTADSYLAIDQGPIIVMIENYRTGLLWELFMSAPEVQSGLTKLEFNY
jgi:hypothetical protein